MLEINIKNLLILVEKMQINKIKGGSQFDY